MLGAARAEEANGLGQVLLTKILVRRHWSEKETYYYNINSRSSYKIDTAWSVRCKTQFTVNSN